MMKRSGFVFGNAHTTQSEEGAVRAHSLLECVRLEIRGKLVESFVIMFILNIQTCWVDSGDHLKRRCLCSDCPSRDAQCFQNISSS